MTKKKALAKNRLKIDQVRILSPKECRDITNTVIELRQKWQKVRRPGPLRDSPYYRLGSSFESNHKSMLRYRKDYQSSNPLMKEHFAWLYKRVQNFLADYFSEPVIFREDASLPGFHIFESDPIFYKHSLPWHTDFDSVLLPWKFPLEKNGIRTFTLPVSLPTAGATLDIKDIFYNGFFRETPAFERAIENAEIIARWPHKIGEVLVQDGQRYHRIGLQHPPFIKGEMRITLQGYAMHQRDYWAIHW